MFREETPINLISKIVPDILIKGGDYKAEEIVGHDIVTSHGGKVFTVPLIQDYSTTSIIQKLKAT